MCDNLSKGVLGLNTMIFTANLKMISPYSGLGAYKEWYVFHAIVNAMMMMGPYGHFPLNSSPYKVVFFSPSTLLSRD